MLRAALLYFSFLFIVSVFAQVEMPIDSEVQLQKLDGEQEVSFVAKVNTDFDVSYLESIGASLGSIADDIATIRISRTNALQLKNVAGISYLQLARKVKPDLVKVVPDVRSDSVYRGFGLSSGYTGKDVIIGITDWGFDYTHPMFYDTAMEHTRILAAWDQFKTSGPAPDGFDYGTVFQGEEQLIAAQRDTVNIYGLATHGSHVAGIAGGGGAGTEHRGIAYEADYLLTTFLVDEAAVIDAFNWMHSEAKKRSKRLVINMSWGLYNLGPLDGTSMISQAIDALSADGVIFVTSGGNNGDVDFHIKKTFASDTMHTRAHFYRGSVANLWGQSISTWGEVGESFGVNFSVYNNAKMLLVESPKFETTSSTYLDSFLVTGADTVFYNVAIDAPHPLNNTPHIRLRIKNDNSSLRVGVKAFASKGTVHFYNVTELTSDVGNWGMPFSAWQTGWVDGDNTYSLGEPASTRSTITVAAHQSEIFTPSGVMGGGFIAPFSSIGPTIDGRMKPDVSAPGVNVASSVSSFTNRNYTLLENVTFNGKSYPFSRFSGTSMSGPAVAGVVALMLEANPNLWYNEVQDILHATAREDIRTGDLSENGDVQWGWGKVNAYAAVKRAEQKLLGVQMSDQPNVGRLYPNPANTLLYIDLDKVVKVEIYNSKGVLVGKGEIGGGKSLIVDSYPSGLYVLRVTDRAIKPMVFMKS